MRGGPWCATTRRAPPRLYHNEVVQDGLPRPTPPGLAHPGWRRLASPRSRLGRSRAFTGCSPTRGPRREGRGLGAPRLRGRIRATATQNPGARRSGVRAPRRLCVHAVHAGSARALRRADGLARAGLGSPRACAPALALPPRPLSGTRAPRGPGRPPFRVRGRTGSRAGREAAQSPEAAGPRPADVRDVAVQVRFSGAPLRAGRCGPPPGEDPATRCARGLEVWGRRGQGFGDRGRTNLASAPSP